MKYLTARAKEPSTWCGVSAMALVLAGLFPQHAAIFNVVSAATAAAAGALPERGVEGAS